MKKAAFYTLGCKVNQYETEAMAELFADSGYEIKEFTEVADVYVINTCSVTNMGDRKSRQIIRRAKKLNPNAVIAVTGCYAQTAPDEVLAIEGVNLVLGTKDRKNIVTLIEDLNTESNINHVSDIMSNHEFEELQIKQYSNRTRAFIKIQEGCNQFCSYCIIPYARGRVRSRKMEEVLEEITNLTKHGCQEFVITGIHVTSYGKDLGDVTLIDLLEEIAKIPEVKRIRLGSLEPGFITKDTLDRLSKMESFCPHFHLSLQSGCDTTLERMNRRYRSAEYAEKCGLLRKYLGNPALTTDVIVGFPMETEEDFQDSYDFVESIHFYETHIFKYSRRHGTKAAAMSGQLTEAQKAVRSDKMLALNEQHAREYEKSMLGGELKVLLEEEVEINGEQWYIGHSMEYIKTAVKKQDNYSVNDIITVKAEEFLEEHTLTGEVLGVE